MCPHERNSRSGWTAKVHKLIWDIRLVPYLLRDQADSGAEILDGQQVSIDVATGGQLIRRPFAGQQRPRSPHAPADEGAAIIALPVAVMVIALPARTFGRVHFQNGIHHLERVLDERVAGFPYSETHQLQESSVHNFLCRILVAVSWTLVGKLQHTMIGVFVSPCALRAGSGIDADIVPCDSRY